MAGHWDEVYRAKGRTALDIAESALAVARDELGFTGNTVAADVRQWRPARRPGAVFGTADYALRR